MLHIHTSVMENSAFFIAYPKSAVQRKTTIDEVYAGDIIGLPDNGTLRLAIHTEGELGFFRGLPSFAEMFKYIENADPMKQKQLAKGIDPVDG